MTTDEVLAIAGVLLLMAWVNRNRLLQARFRTQRAKFIAAYAFPGGLRFKLDQAFPALSTEQTTMVIEGLRAWFLLVAANPRAKLGMPSKAVDTAWHEFILLTKNYADFCDRAFGTFLHHVPHEGNATAQKDGLACTWGLGAGLLAGGAGAVAGAAMLSGRDLFGLDQRLGLPGGNSYEATDFAALEKRYQQMQSSSGGGSDSGGDSGGSSSDSDSGNDGGGGDGGGGGCGGGCGS